MSESVAFGKKLRYFTDQNGPKGGPHENKFRVFSNSEMNITMLIGKRRCKKWGQLSSFHASFLSYGP